MIIPGLYGYVSACKWLTSIEATTYEAYWVRDSDVAVMGRNEGAVKALQHRAVRRLAQLLPEGLR